MNFQISVNCELEDTYINKYNDIEHGYNDRMNKIYIKNDQVHFDELDRTGGEGGGR